MKRDDTVARVLRKIGATGRVTADDLNLIASRGVHVDGGQG